MPSVRLWVNPTEDPEMDPKDKNWTTQQPLRGFLEILRGSKEEQYSERKAMIVEEILNDYPILVHRILNWLYFAINGGSLTRDAAVSVFLDYFLSLVLDRKEEALNCLQRAQEAYMSAPLPSKFHMQGDGDQEEDEEEDEEEEEEEEDDDCELLRVYWESKAPRKWRALIRTEGDVQVKICYLWADALRTFFAQTQNLPPSIKKGAVQALQQMRKINKSIWMLDSWRNAVKVSGLAEVMIGICQSSHLFKVQSPHVVETYRYNVWRETLGEILVRWTPNEMAERKIEVLPDEAKDGRIACTAENILTLMCKHIEMVPRISHPSSVFFLVTYDNFVHTWEIWLEGALRHRNVETINVDLRYLHRALRGMNLEVFERTHKIPEQLKVILDETETLVQHNRLLISNTNSPADTPEVSPSPSPSPSPHPNPSTHHIFNSSNIPPYSLSQLSEAPELDPSQQFVMPKIFKNTCNFCKDLPDEDQWCIRRYFVHELPGYEKLEGCIITTALGDDRLDPKPTKGSKPGKTPTYYHPDELGLKQIKPRPEVQKKCGRDVTLLINDEKVMVGAVKYNAFVDEVVEEMDKHFHASSNLHDVQRGVGFRAFAWGSMKALGSRVPQGGNAGSGYGPYKDLDAREISGIRSMFNHAKIADALVHTAQGLYKPVTKHVDKYFVAQGMDPIGSGGGNLYICHNYCSPMHQDRDASLSICMQHKKKCKEGEWNFVYLKWGVYLQNGPNTLWSVLFIEIMIPM
ncbi:hypothetical protein PTI98_008461 [Pleurotus ostreatus]|nr:hypothetical protein PTI98_008461 [Pleurotus ostreatus]